MTALEVGEEREIAPGVYISRRSLVKSLSTLLVAGSFGSEAHAQAVKLAEASLSLEEFIKEGSLVANRLASDTSRMGQGRYLLAIAALATRTAAIPVPVMRDSGQGETGGTHIGVNPGAEAFTILHWRLDPGARIRPHAHTYGNVVTLGLEGEALVSNYETIADPDYRSKRPFKIRRTRRQRLRPGSVNLVNLEEDFIHGFEAGPDGARGLDITTRLAPRGPTPYLILRNESGEPLMGEWSLDNPRTA